MFLVKFFKFIAKLLFFTGRVENNAFEKPLPEKEERECFIKMKEGDKLAEEKLIKHNQRLVAHISKKYKNCGTDSEDLISIGTIGLMKAIKTFSYDKGSNFSTYASRCIDNEILMTFRSSKKNVQTVYLEDIISVDKDGNNLSLQDVLCDSSPEVEHTINNKLQFEKVKKILSQKLNKREQEIINKRYGLFGERPRTQMELAEELNISRSYISRLEKKAIKTIRSNIILN